MERDEESWAREYVMLPAARFPSISAVAPLLADVSQEDQFVLTVELLLDAIAARAATAGQGSRRSTRDTPRSSGG
ncbi:hypothetical protein WEH80_10595 [Actinomycetes bacterium KLBMP 9759]